ncbi:DUF554 domain-containing protein [Peptoniphilus equinus]|uniref:DUF554 domain-containing protein n=1 Tax=Peptoniphilus equinus TaxID=3016343 RepID=A0ABY7QT22_9FIRM|nr:DUF554 domain-containing protein [Peptoniphilus equinus]WBW49940.1 DUF554 domain-containing protein [Peptoniphilus equinus]
MFGVIINSLGIILGSTLGLVIGQRFSKELQDQIMTILGLGVFVIGLQGALSGGSVTVMIVSCVVGLLIGHALQLETRLNQLAFGLTARVVKNGDSAKVAEGFITTSLMFCVGSMSIIGSLNAGLLHSYDVLYVKTALDSISAIIFASALGVGVVFSSVSLFIYQSFLVAISGFLEPIMTESMLTEIATVGGLLIMAIGCNMLKITTIKNANLIPAILIPVLYQLVKISFNPL